MSQSRQIDREFGAITCTSLTASNLVSATVAPRLVTKTTAFTLTSADSGATFFLSNAAGFTITLPPLSTLTSGFKVEFIVSTAPTSGNYVIAQNSVDSVSETYGVICTAQDALGSSASTGNSAVKHTNIVSSLGAKADYVSYVSNGQLFFVSGMITNYNGVTFS